MKLTHVVLAALVLCNALAVEICSVQFCITNLRAQCRTPIVCVTSPCPQPPPQSCVSWLLEQLPLTPIDPPVGPLPTLPTLSPPTLPPPTLSPPTLQTTTQANNVCDDPANIADGAFFVNGEPDCCALEGVGCRQLGESCSTTAVLLSVPVACEAGLTCVIADDGNLALDVPNSGTCEAV